MKKINEDTMAFMQDILGIQTEMGVEMLRAACECVQLFDTKQLDYGSSNIALGGEMGIAVRLQDKVSRMRNLLLKELKGDANVNHESLEDTFKDAANYGMIGLILKQAETQLQIPFHAKQNCSSLFAYLKTTFSASTI